MTTTEPLSAADQLANSAPADPAELLSDATLIRASRSGDARAYGTLYERHSAAGLRLARQIMRHHADADDVVAEAFARVLRVIRQGGGPAQAFRPYLLTAIRRVAFDQLRRQRTVVPTDDLPDHGQPFVDPALAELESTLITRAFMSLPERWNAVLWHTEIEEAKPAEVAVLLGLTPNGVAALRYRAREGLRQAYLQMHMSGVTREECRPVASQLGAYVRGAVPKRAARRMAGHLRECGECQAAAAELTSINGSLRGLLAPAFLGSAASAYLAGATGHAVAAAGGTAAAAGATTAGATTAGATTAGATTAGAATAGAATATAGGTAAAGAAGSSAATGGLRWLRAAVLHRPVISTAAGVLLAATVPVVTLTHHDHRPHHRAGSEARQVASPPVVAASPRASPGSPLAVPSPSVSGAGEPTPTPVASSSASPSAAPTPAASSPVVAAQLGVTVDVSGLLGLGLAAVVSVRVADPGSAATAGVDASLTLPPGIALLGLASSSQPGWTCAASAAGADCVHGPVAAGTATTAAVRILVVSLSGCGRQVLVTATSGTLSASGQSASSVQC